MLEADPGPCRSPAPSALLAHPIRSILALPPHGVSGYLEESALHFWCWLGSNCTHCLPGTGGAALGSVLYSLPVGHGMSPGWDLKRDQLFVLFFLVEEGMNFYFPN